MGVPIPTGSNYIAAAARIAFGASPSTYLRNFEHQKEKEPKGADLGIQGGEGVIQEDDISICIGGPGQGDALLLTSTHIHSPVAQLGQVASCTAHQRVMS